MQNTSSSLCQNTIHRYFSIQEYFKELLQPFMHTSENAYLDDPVENCCDSIGHLLGPCRCFYRRKSIAKILFSVKKKGHFGEKGCSFELYEPPGYGLDLCMFVYRDCFVRNNRSFIICYARTTLKKLCVSIYGPKMYNNLQTEVKLAQNISILKNQFKNCFDKY